MPKAPTYLLVCVLTLAACCVDGCGPEITRQVYDTLYVGQPAADVERAMGPPTERQGERWVYLSEQPFTKAVIVFKDGRLAEKSWTCVRDKPSPE